MVAACLQPDWPERHVVSLGPLLAAAIQRFVTNGSLGDLY
jgi:hypothetical protein